MLTSKPGSLGNKGGRDGSRRSVPILGIRNVVLNKQIYLHFLHRGHTMRQSRTGIFTAHLLWDQLSHAAYAAPVNATRMKNGSSISAAQGIVYSAPGGKQNLASVFMPEKPVPVRNSLLRLGFLLHQLEGAGGSKSPGMSPVTACTFPACRPHRSHCSLLGAPHGLSLGHGPAGQHPSHTQPFAQPALPPVRSQLQGHGFSQLRELAWAK